MRSRHLFVFALPLLAGLAACADRGAVAEDRRDDPIARLEGGTPLPATARKVGFPWMGKQSLMCVGESVERMVAFVDFGDDTREAVGSVVLDEKGIGRGEFGVLAADMRTAHAGRDEKMRGPQWLDAESHPKVTLKIDRLERVRPTVWRATGTWTMRGVSKPVDFHANVRYVPEMQNVGKDVVRVSASFPVSLKAHGVGGEWAGTPACADEWVVNVVLLGLIEGP